MIYFIRAGDRPYVKIGVCAGNPAVRMAGLQVGSVEQLVLLGTVEGGPADEREWHSRFDYLRVRGEWFEFTPELQQAVGIALGHHEPSAEYLARQGARALEHLTRIASGGKAATN